MFAIKYIVVVLIFITLLSSCNSQMSYRDEISSLIEKGTDSTYERVYIKKKGWSDFYYSKTRNRIIYETKTSFGKMKIETNFEYGYYEDNRVLKEIYSVFNVDSGFSPYGHSFDFVKGEYAWLLNEEGGSSYICNIDTLGNIINEIGTIQVDGFKDKYNKTTNLFFTTVFHEIDSVIISSPHIESEKYEVVPYSWQPMMSSILLDYSRDSIFYINTYSTRKKDRIKNVFIDTFYVN